MSYFADFLPDALVERPLTLGGKTIPTFWRPLTAGQKLALLKGQIVKTTGEGGVMEVNLQESAERNQRLVQMTLCTPDGAAVYKSIGELQAEPARLIEALIRIAGEVSREGDEGNV